MHPVEIGPTKTHQEPPYVTRKGIQAEARTEVRISVFAYTRCWISLPWFHILYCFSIQITTNSFLLSYPPTHFESFSSCWGRLHLQEIYSLGSPNNQTLVNKDAVFVSRIITVILNAWKCHVTINILINLRLLCMVITILTLHIQSIYIVYMCTMYM